MIIPMRRLILFSVFIAVVVSGHVMLAQRDGSAVIVFGEAGFPAADSATPSSQQLAALFPQAKSAGAEQLRDALAASASRLLVLPYGSAFPESEWGTIKSFLDRGGNLLVLGGMPFARAAYRDSQGWHLRDFSVRFIRPL